MGGQSLVELRFLYGGDVVSSTIYERCPYLLPQNSAQRHSVFNTSVEAELLRFQKKIEAKYDRSQLKAYKFPRKQRGAALVKSKIKIRSKSRLSQSPDQKL